MNDNHNLYDDMNDLVYLYSINELTIICSTVEVAAESLSVGDSVDNAIGTTMSSAWYGRYDPKHPKLEPYLSSIR